MISWSYSITPPERQAAPSLAAPLELQIQKDLALDPVTWRLKVPLEWVTGADAVAQRIGIRLRIFYGEWFLDQSEGIPYIESIMVSGPDLTLIESIFRKVVETCPGVARLEAFKMSLDESTRTLTITDFDAVVSDGSRIVSVAPFRVVE